MGGILNLLCLFHVFVYGIGFLSRGFTDRREILHDRSSPILGDGEFWASTGDIRRDMLLAEAVVSDIRALWRSGLSARVPECRKLKTIGLALSLIHI